MEYMDNYRSALAANNRGIGLLRQGRFQESLVVFRSAFPRMGMTSPAKQRSFVSSNDATPVKIRKNPLVSPEAATFPIHVWDEDDLHTTCVISTPSDGLAIAIALQKFPHVGEDLTFATQIGSFLYNFALSYLLCGQHGSCHTDTNDETKAVETAVAPQSSKHLVQRAKILLQHAKAVVFPKLKVVLENKRTTSLSLALLNLSSLVLSGLIAVSGFEKDDKSQAELFEQQLVLNEFFASVQQDQMPRFTAKAA